jgi:hypothetical protein
VAAGQPWGDPVAGLAVTAFICHVGWEVTADVTSRLADAVDPDVIRAAEAAAGSVPGVVHAHARARWTGRTLRVEIEGWVDPGITARDAGARPPGRQRHCRATPRNRLFGSDDQGRRLQPHVSVHRQRVQWGSDTQFVHEGLFPGIPERHPSAALADVGRLPGDLPPSVSVPLACGRAAPWC